jgi:heme A synthase
VCVQITLGALTVLSQKQHLINSFHVVTGASVLATSLVLTLRAHRVRFTRDGDATASAVFRPIAPGALSTRRSGASA